MTSRYTIPIDVIEDKVSLKRLLVELSSDLTSTIDSFTTIDSDIKDIDSVLKALQLAVTELVTDSSGDLQPDLASIHDHVALVAATYSDFNAAAWATLEGNSQFTELGSNLVNAPFVPVPATTYTFYIESALTVGGGVVQRVLTEIPGVSLTAHYRTGDTFAVALTNGWAVL